MDRRVIQLQALPAQMVHNTSRCPRDNMGFLPQGLNLLINGKSAENCRYLQTLLSSYMKHFLADLHCQFPGRLQYQVCL